ncbi:hypothetical protein ig2599ANME_0508 [groundwater metagenome]
MLDEVSYILLMYKGAMVLKTQDRQKIRERIKKDTDIAFQCYSVVDKFNEFLATLEGLQIVPINKNDYMQATVLGKTCRLLPSDALHASVMKSSKIFNIATRDTDFERVMGIKVWEP